MIANMSKVALYSYGWRIPFLLGSMLAVIGFYIRKNIAESQEFKEMLQSKKETRMPIVILFSEYRKELIMGVILVVLASLLTAVFHVFLPNLFVKFLHLDLAVASTASSVGALTIAVSIIFFALLTSKINPITIVKFSICGIIIVLILLLFGKLTLMDINSIYVVVILLSVLVGGINGVYWGVLVDLFPVEVRYSGVATSFSIASLIGGGLTPLWTSSLLASTNNYKSIVVVCLVISIISLINSVYLAKHFKTRI